METVKIDKYINNNIEKGDFVRIIDGSGLSCDQMLKKPYIIFAYPKVTGSKENLKDCIFEVVKTNVTHKFSEINVGLNSCYLQDVEISINGKIFRTCSKFLTVVKKPLDLPIINGYQGYLKDGFIKYGCAQLSVAWFIGSENRRIKKLVLDSDVVIKAKHIRKIREYLKNEGEI